MKKTTLDAATIALFVLGLCYFFWPTLTSIHAHWIQVSANYSHGYLLLMAGVYLFYEARTRKATPNNYKYWQLFAIPLIASSAIWMIADIVQIQIVQQLSILAISYFFLAMVFGIQGGKDALFPVGLIVLAIPIWGSIVELLQYLTVAVCTFGLSLLHIPAHIHEFYIEIPDGVIHVADSCSGLNYFLIAVSLGAIQAQLSLDSLPRKMVLTIFAAAIGLISNWIRVFSLVVIGHVTKMQSSLMEGHFWHGWIIFGLSLIPIFIVSHKLRGGSGSESESSNEESYQSPSLILAKPSFLISALALLLSFSGPIALKFLSQSESNFQLSTLEENLLDWKFRSASQLEWQPNYFGADKVITGTLEKELLHAELSIYLYLDQHQGKELIHYKNSIASGPWKQVAKRTAFLSGTQVVTSRLESEQGSREKAIVYWYQVGETNSNNENEVKILQLKNFFKGRSDAALIAISSDCYDGCDAAFKFLEQLILPVKSAYIESMVYENP